MRAAISFLFIAILLVVVPLASSASAAVAAAGASASTAGAPAAPEQPGTPPAQWLYECSPLCSYYYTICQEECTFRGGIKSFYCTPPPPGLCASFTCTCNKGL
jgi:hypothetical protein